MTRTRRVSRLGPWRGSESQPYKNLKDLSNRVRVSVVGCQLPGLTPIHACVFSKNRSMLLRTPTQDLLKTRNNESIYLGYIF